MLAARRCLVDKAIVFLLLSTSAMGQENQLPLQQSLATDVPYPYRIPPTDLMGSDFSPEDVNSSVGLADWDQLWFTETGPPRFKLTKMRLYGFGEYANGQTIDWSTDEPAVLRVVRVGLHASNVRRAALSDLSKGRAQVGRGAHLGVIQLVVDGKPLVIGVSQVGFFLGIWHGTSHQHFESWILAKELDVLLTRITGKQLEPKTFARLSGEGFIARGKSQFEELTTPSPDASSAGER